MDELKALKETQGWGQCLVPAHLRCPLYRTVKWDDVVLFSLFFSVMVSMWQTKLDTSQLCGIYYAFRYQTVSHHECLMEKLHITTKCITWHLRDTLWLVPDFENNNLKQKAQQSTAINRTRWENVSKSAEQINRRQFFILTSKSQCKANNTPSLRSPVVGKERMRSGHWLGSLLWHCWLLLLLLLLWASSMGHHSWSAMQQQSATWTSHQPALSTDRNRRCHTSFVALHMYTGQSRLVAISSNRHHNDPAQCGSDSGEATVIKGGQNLVVGLWGQPLKPNSSLSSTDLWCLLNENLATVDSCWFNRTVKKACALIPEVLFQNKRRKKTKQQPAKRVHVRKEAGK